MNNSSSRFIREMRIPTRTLIPRTPPLGRPANLGVENCMYERSVQIVNSLFDRRTGRLATYRPAPSGNLASSKRISSHLLGTFQGVGSPLPGILSPDCCAQIIFSIHFSRSTPLYNL